MVEIFVQPQVLNVFNNQGEDRASNQTVQTFASPTRLPELQPLHRRRPSRAPRNVGRTPRRRTGTTAPTFGTARERRRLPAAAHVPGHGGGPLLALVSSRFFGAGASARLLFFSGAWVTLGRDANGQARSRSLACGPRGCLASGCGRRRAARPARPSRGAPSSSSASTRSARTTCRSTATRASRRRLSRRSASDSDPLREGVLARAAHASLARVDLHGARAGGARHPRQPRLPPAQGRSDARRAPEEGRLRDGRRRLLLRAEGRQRHRAGLRLLRRRGRAAGGEGGARARPARRRRDREDGSRRGWRRRPAGPLFAFLHLYEPHTPYEPPEPFKTRYASVPYDGEIAAADAIVGTFLAFLKQKGLYDQALIVFLSDHGEGLGEHGEAEHGMFLYRETLQVPLLVKLPGAKRAGTSVATPVALSDVFTTVGRDRRARGLSGPRRDRLARRPRAPARRPRRGASSPRRSSRASTSAGASSARSSRAAGTTSRRRARRSTTSRRTRRETAQPDRRKAGRAARAARRSPQEEALVRDAARGRPRGAQEARVARLSQRRARPPPARSTTRRTGSRRSRSSARASAR